MLLAHDGLLEEAEALAERAGSHPLATALRMMCLGARGDWTGVEARLGVGLVTDPADPLTLEARARHLYLYACGCYHRERPEFAAEFAARAAEVARLAGMGAYEGLCGRLVAECRDLALDPAGRLERAALDVLSTPPGSLAGGMARRHLADSLRRRGLYARALEAYRDVDPRVLTPDRPALCLVLSGRADRVDWAALEGHPAGPHLLALARALAGDARAVDLGPWPTDAVPAHVAGLVRTARALAPLASPGADPERALARLASAGVPRVEADQRFLWSLAALGALVRDPGAESGGLDLEGPAREALRFAREAPPEAEVLPLAVSWAPGAVALLAALDPGCDWAAEAVARRVMLVDPTSIRMGGLTYTGRAPVCRWYAERAGEAADDGSISRTALANRLARWRQCAHAAGDPVPVLAWRVRAAAERLAGGARGEDAAAWREAARAYAAGHPMPEWGLSVGA